MEKNDRKRGHIDLTQKSQCKGIEPDSRFFYEPLFTSHPSSITDLECNFNGKKLGAPLWISSMTGGTGVARQINRNLATICREFKLGMGLGSCRPLLESDVFLEDFNLRPIIGDELPFYANMGIAQLEQLIENKELNKLDDILSKLQTDGLIIHVNPMQEWFQFEGDRYSRPAIETIERIVTHLDGGVIVKEVGQGFGPQSLKALFELPLDAIEFAAFGGTNFSKLEAMRSTDSSISLHENLTLIGHTAQEMVAMANQIQTDLGESALCRQVIISGGVSDYLDGFYLREKSVAPALVGHASAFLEYAHQGVEPLRNFVKNYLEGLLMAKAFLRVR